MLRNKFNDIRHDLKINSKKEFAKICGFKNYNQYCRWENHDVEPDINSYWVAFNNLKKLKPEIHLEDLIQEWKDSE